MLHDNNINVNSINTSDIKQAVVCVEARSHVFYTQRADHRVHSRCDLCCPPDDPLESAAARSPLRWLVHRETDQVAPGVHHLARTGRRGRVPDEAGER